MHAARAASAFGMGSRAVTLPAAVLCQAGDKFKMALAIEPRKHDALWCLGNAYTSQVFLTAHPCHSKGLDQSAMGTVMDHA